MIFKNMRFLFLGLALLSFCSCGFYSLSGVTLPANVKTFQVDYFGYQAVLVEPGIERDFKIKLEDLIQDQSRLSLTPKNGDYVYQGAYVYDVSVEDGFELRGTITHYTDEELIEMSDNYWWYGDNDIERILYIGEYFYTVSQGMLKASMMDSLEEVNSLRY